MKKILSLIVLLNFFTVPLFATGSFSDNLSAPHTFSSGETISSNKMNENFSKIFEELNKIRRYLVSSGSIVAEFISFKNSYALVEKENGFKIQVNLSDGYFYSKESSGTGSYVYYESNDCTGDKYTEGSFLPNEIFNVRTYNNGQNDYSIYYTSDSYKKFVYRSQNNFQGNSCSETTWNTNEGTYIKFYENNVNLTGITSPNFQLPIIIRGK